MKANHHLLIDEYLKTDGSKVNELALLRKTTVRRHRDISLTTPTIWRRGK